MLLAIDVGNTNITCALFEGDEIAASFRLMTKQPRTSDEYGMTITSLLKGNRLKKKEVTDIVFCSVVPKVNYALCSALIKYLKIRPMAVTYTCNTGIKIKADSPDQVGADRIVDAAAAYALYGGPIIVIDYGPATTYDLVDQNGVFAGAVTAPGVQTSASALWTAAAKLPEIEIRKPKTILAQNTVTSMQAGIYYGQIGQTEAIIRQIKKEAGCKNIKTIATGGLAQLIKNGTGMIDLYNKDLTMLGLKIIYDRECKHGDVDAHRVEK